MSWKDSFPRENIFYETENGILYNAEAIEMMSKFPEKIFDAIITDPPYGVTACGWDSPIPLNNFIMQPKSKRSKKMVPIYRDEYILQELKKGRDYKEICEYFDKNSKEGMWQKLNKLIKPNGAIVLFGSEPFSSALRMSNIKNYRYDWIWEKSKPSNFLNAKKQPMRKYENVSIFYKRQCSYNPQGLTIGKQNKNSGTENTYGKVKKDFKQDVTYTGYPHNILKFGNIVGESAIHPTQKPVALMEYLIKTYTNEGDLVLDFTCGSGTTLVAAEKLSRRWVGIEISGEYCKIAKNRIEDLMPFY